MASMIVGIDLRCVPSDGSPGGGVAHAARAVTEALLKQDVRWDWHIYDASGSSLRRAVRRQPCDVLLALSGAVAPGLRVPVIPWIHDLQIYDHPEWFPQSFWKRFLTTRLYRRGALHAPVIFAISEDTKRDLISRFGISSEKIYVTYEGGDDVLGALHDEDLTLAKQQAKRRLREQEITERFVLILGSVQPRKNIPFAVQAWRQAVSTSSSRIDLMIVGETGWGEVNIDTADQGSSTIHRIHTCSDEHRRDVLLAAELVLLPSLHEGFGLVALEAMQAETVVLAARAGALPEVVGDQGVLLDPTDLDGWTNTMARYLDDKQSRKNLASYGKKRSEIFGWDKTAKKMVQEILRLRSTSLRMTT